MTRQKLKRFHVKRIYSTLLLSYGALLAAPFIAVFLLLSFWKNSTENYYSEIMKNDLTEGRMAFEKQLDIMCAGAFSVSNDSDLKWVYFLDGLKDGDNNIAALIRCNDMLRQTFADSEHYQNYSVIMKNELTQRQNMCLRYKYINHKTQSEIADILKLSQPTVSRHISTAKDIVNKNLKYCYVALSKCLDEYDRLNNLC